MRMRMLPFANSILKSRLLETAYFSHPFYGTPRANTFITF